MNAITWFEIPTADLDRAAAFYAAILGKALRREVFAGTPHAIFPLSPDGAKEGAQDGARDGVGGALIFDARRLPATNGSTVYLNSGTPENLDAVLGRVVGAGGAVLVPKTDIGDPGFIALIQDSEGNQIGLHSER